MPETKIFSVNPEHVDSAIISSAAEVLKRGGLVVFPTETVYGLGADALNTQAVEKVFDAKGRPADNPLIVHISKEEQLFDIIDEMPKVGTLLTKQFWPGPLTLVVKRTFLVPDNVVAHMDTVAVRMPNHPVALALIEAFGGGVVAPSANLSTKPSPTTAQHVLSDLRGKVDMILDAGPTPIGVESTVVDITTDPPLILRHGGLPIERIAAIAPRIQVAVEVESLMRSPGTRHRHYAPAAQVVVVEEGDSEAYAAAVQTHRQQGKQVGAIVHSASLVNLERSQFVRALPNSPEIIAQQLYSLLREMDDYGVQVVVVEGIAKQGLGAAVMDRIKRAAESS
ncbi:MAG: threonylcarbamoyl-AMP synthase [Ignavibacteriae bacterium]|nr:threonylcarbamoyl-AMP synthase [Ignavibacteriota bacterium]